MARVDKSIEINVPPEKIFPLITWDRVPEFYDDIKKVEWKSKAHAMELGATVHVVSETAGTKGEWDAEITEFVPNEKVAWRTISGNTTIIYHATLTPTKTGSSVNTTFDYELPYAVLGKLIDKLRVHKALEKGAEKALQRMKSVAEK